MDSWLGNRFPALTKTKKKRERECPSNEFQLLPLPFSPGRGRRGENKRVISWFADPTESNLPIACTAGINNRKRGRNNIFHPGTYYSLFLFSTARWTRVSRVSFNNWPACKLGPLRDYFDDDRNLFRSNYSLRRPQFCSIDRSSIHALRYLESHVLWKFFFLE